MSPLLLSSGHVLLVVIAQQAIIRETILQIAVIPHVTLHLLEYLRLERGECLVLVLALSAFSRGPS